MKFGKTGYDKQSRRSCFPILISFCLLWCYPSGLEAQNKAFQHRGIALIWYGDQENLNDRNGIVTAGQIVFMWRDFEPEEGKFNFQELDKQLKAVTDKGLKTTIQINGNVHPDFVYAKVPYLKGIEIRGTRDHEIGYGAPMYWHESYKALYSKMISALASHLLASPYRETILGIRQNYCAVGTEHHNIPEEFRNRNGWYCEPGISLGQEWPWTIETANKYKQWAIDLFIDSFNPPAGIFVFMRASAISDSVVSQKQLNMVEKGELGLFHTSTEPQPRNEEKDGQYKVFLSYCKTGKTPGFMESWSAAATTSDRWLWEKTKHPITKEQFNYWTILCDLHCGAAFPAMRPEDVDEANFSNDYKFAARYAGYLANPESAPGAWIAFREGDFLKGDYTFLMERVASDNSKGIYNADKEKYGLWCRRIEENQHLELNLDPMFEASLNNTEAKISITYKDAGTKKFEVLVSDKVYTIDKINTGKWVTTNILVKISKPESVKIQVLARHEPVDLHMIEIVKTSNFLSGKLF